jgi:hypothetical protein
MKPIAKKWKRHMRVVTKVDESYNTGFVKDDAILAEMLVKQKSDTVQKCTQALHDAFYRNYKKIFKKKYGFEVYDDDSVFFVNARQENVRQIRQILEKFGKPNDNNVLLSFYKRRENEYFDDLLEGFSNKDFPGFYPGFEAIFSNIRGRLKKMVAETLNDEIKLCLEITQQELIKILKTNFANMYPSSQMLTSNKQMVEEYMYKDLQLFIEELSELLKEYHKNLELSLNDAIKE